MWSPLDVSGVGRVGVVLEVCDEAAEHGAREELPPVGPRLGRGARDDGRLGLAGAGPEALGEDAVRVRRALLCGALDS